MDRNLGALETDYTLPASRGLYYQWGRKDPFPYPATATDAYIQAPTVYAAGFEYAESDPRTSGTESPYDVMTLEWATAHPTTYMDGVSFEDWEEWASSLEMCIRDSLIATARSNKVSVCLGFQDFSQLERDYGEKEAKVIINTVGNIFSGQVVGDTARTLSERFGKIVQLRESHSVSNENVTTSTNTQLETLIPVSKISNLTQGMFVGSVADNFDERIEQKIFHAEIVIDNDKVKAETAAYVPIPEISSFIGEDGKDHMEEIVKENYYRVKADVAELVLREIARIEADPKLSQLLPKKKQG